MRSLGDDRTLQVVLAVTAVALVARLVLLGDRIAHFDEARVAYWTLWYAETGQVHYRFIIHGPFLQHVGSRVVTVLAPTDFAARLPVALISGLLPLSALWLRHRLTGLEVGGLAVFLAIDPIILYYSRFMRSTLLVATFCFVAFTAFVRWYDGFGHRYLYLGAALLALGFTAKENAIIYVLCWLGAGALVVDTALYRPREYASGRDRLAAAVDRYRPIALTAPETRRRLLGTGGHVAGTVVVFAAIIVVFYAPRGGDAGLWTGSLGTTLSRTVADIVAGYDYWFGHGGELTFDAYRDRLGLFVGTTLTFSAPLFVLAGFGLVHERYGRAESRPLVMFCGYWGLASVVGYPLGADIWGAWIIVNALVPLAVPAAVGLAVILTAGRTAWTVEDHVGTALASGLVVLFVGQLLVVGAAGVYMDPTGPDNELVQFAQPQQEMRTAVDDTVVAAAGSDGERAILFYGGSDFVTMDEQAERHPACLDWFKTLPWAWYLAANDVSATCATTDQLPESLPPVVVAEAECTRDRPVECRTDPAALTVDPALDERIPASYDRHGFLHRTTGGSYFHGMVVYVAPQE